MHTSVSIVRQAALVMRVRPTAARRLISRTPAASLSNASSTPPAEPATSTEPPTFQYAKSEALFTKISDTLTKPDVVALQDEISKILGRTWRKNEFYYSGFGVRRGSKAGGGADAGEVAAAPAVKTVFDLKLLGFDPKSKIKVIKEVRSIAGLGLKEAKDLVESAPKVILKDLKTEQAEELKTKLEELGATIELV